MVNFASAFGPDFLPLDPRLGLLAAMGQGQSGMASAPGVPVQGLGGLAQAAAPQAMSMGPNFTPNQPKMAVIDDGMSGPARHTTTTPTAAGPMSPGMPNNALRSTMAGQMGSQPQGRRYLLNGRFGDTLRNNQGALFNLSAGLLGGRGGLQQALANMPQAMQGDRDAAKARERNMAVQNWLGRASSTMSPEQAALAQAYPEASAGAALQRMFAKPATTPDITNFEYAQANPGFTGYQQRAGSAGSPSYGLTPVYGTDAQGNVVLMQIGKNGEVIQSSLPEGVTPMSPGELNQQRAAGTAVGRGQGEAQVNLPGAEHAAQRMLYDIDQIINSPGLGSVTGPIQGRIGDWGQFDPKSVEAVSRIRKVQADAFMQAYEALKGAGQITEFESQAGANALTRLADRTLSDADYIAAAKEAKTEIEKLLDLARRRANGTAPMPAMNAPPGTAPAAGGSGWQDAGGGVRIRAK